MFNTDIHQFKTRYRKMISMIDRSDLSDTNKELIKQFAINRKRKIGYPAVVRYTLGLYQVAGWLNKDLDKVTLNDLDMIFDKIENGEITQGKKGKQGKPYAHATFSNFKLSVKVFMQDIGKNDIANEINTTRKRKEININNLWTERELNKLIDAIDNTQEKAIASMTIDAGARIGEIGGMAIENVIMEADSLEPEEYFIQVTGKTGARTILLTWSKKFVLAWLLSHPNKDDKESPLWIDRNGKQRRYSTLKVVFKRAGKKCGINKPTNPHIFRKSMTTILKKKGYDNMMIKRRMGWSRTSTIMESVYAGVTDQDMWAEERRIKGVTKKQQQILPNFRTCPFCFAGNQIRAEKCSMCGEIMDIAKREQMLMDKNIRKEVIKAIISMKETDDLKKIGDVFGIKQNRK